MPYDGAMSRPALLLAVLALIAALSPFGGPAAAAELVMVEEKGCPYCERWEAEVGVVYAKTPQGRRAPLRRIEIDGPRPDDLRHLKRLVYTPTFILIDKGREVGRIIGYPGEDFFWGLLDELIGKLGGSDTAGAT